MSRSSVSSVHNISPRTLGPIVEGKDEPNIEIPEFKQRKSSSPRTTSGIWKRLSLNFGSHDTLDDEIRQFLEFENKTLLEKFEKNEILRLSNVFKDKKITCKDFQKVFGLFGSSSKILFDCLDTKKEGCIDSSRYVLLVATLLKGSAAERIKLGFDIFDLHKDAKVTLDSFINVMKTLFLGIDAVNLLEVDPVSFSKSTFPMIDVDKKDYFTLEDYTKFLETNSGELIGLGHLKSSNYSIKRLTPPGEMIYFGSKLWSPSLEMMVGIRHTVRMFGKPTRSFKKEDFTVKVEFEVPTAMEDSAIFTSYSPQVFASLRQTFEITEDEYSISLGPEQILGNLLMGRLGSFSEKTSDGKSGSFFFFSNDGRFMAKTIPKNEAKCFLKILPLYYKYMIDNPETLLVKIFGWHELHEQHFVIMGSIFPTSIKVTECYDLKGSTQGRTNKNGFVKKDLDIKKGRIKLPKVEKTKILAQIKKDTEFLKSLNIIDYSFLCGIHDGDSTSNVSVLANCQTLKSTTVVLTQTEIFFMGIIDIFTVYDLKKSTEHSVKSIVFSSNSISAVPANQYQDRFCKFIDTCIE